MSNSLDEDPDWQPPNNDPNLGEYYEFHEHQHNSDNDSENEFDLTEPRALK